MVGGLIPFTPSLTDDTSTDGGPSDTPTAVSKKRLDLRRAQQWQRRAAARQGRGRRGGGVRGPDDDGNSDDGDVELEGFEPTPWLKEFPYVLAWTVVVDAAGKSKRYGVLYWFVSLLSLT